MAELFFFDAPGKVYWDRKSFSSFEEHLNSLKGSRFIYVGNLSFYTTEFQINELFSKVGEVVRVIMGLDRNKRTPCGFCFVEYRHCGDALAAINFISGTCLDERVIRAEMDPGFKEGRQFGRGSSGGQVRDEKRKSYDPARGGMSNAMILAEQAQFASASGSSKNSKYMNDQSSVMVNVGNDHQSEIEKLEMNGPRGKKRSAYGDEVDEYGRTVAWSPVLSDEADHPVENGNRNKVAEEKYSSTNPEDINLAKLDIGQRMEKKQKASMEV
mmetsp:Transcript_11763/g.17541  ORF Transcript_11763/g.17541 Transcript_11763/m.17541 type:complete len:270 (+) Transcript_11763:94-903(+)